MAIASSCRPAGAAFLNAEREIGPELDEPALLSVPMKGANAVATNAAAIGRTLGDLADDVHARGVYVESLQRGTQVMPRESWTRLERGDVIRLIGAPEDVDRAGSFVGFVERDLAGTDLTFLAAGICAGVVLGLLKVNIGGMALGLGTAGSILVIGLAGGWMRSRYPVFGAIPEPAQRLLMDIGLIVFVAVIGLHAGPHAVEAFRASGGAYFAKIFAAGMIVTVVPLAVGTLTARYIFRMSPADAARRPRGRADLHSRADGAQGGQRQQRRLAGVHGAVRDRQHRPHDLGAGGRGRSCMRCEARHETRV